MQVEHIPAHLLQASVHELVDALSLALEASNGIDFVSTSALVCLIEQLQREATARDDRKAGGAGD